MRVQAPNFSSSGLKTIQVAKQLRLYVSDLISIWRHLPQVAKHHFFTCHLCCRGLIRFVKPRYAADLWGEWKPRVDVVRMVSVLFHHFPRKAWFRPASHVCTVQTAAVRQGKSSHDSPSESVYVSTGKIVFISVTLLTAVKENLLLHSTQRIPL